MKKLFLLSVLYFTLSFSGGWSEVAYAQTNLVSNPSFEEFWGACTPFFGSGFNNNFDSLQFQGFCVLKDWMTASNSPDVWSLHLNSAGQQSLPINMMYCKNIYPHSDSTIAGGVEFLPQDTNLREIIENKLIVNLKAGHHYQFRMYAHLFDTLGASSSNGGKIVSINSFSAFFSDTVVNLHNNFDIRRFTPQVQINKMIADTGHWVLLQDTFVAEGGERYMCIGNFKPDSLLQWQLVDSIRNLPIASYYFFDDVSLIDLDSASGIDKVTMNDKRLMVYPNPCENKLSVSGIQFSENTKVEIENVLGQVMVSLSNHLITDNCQLTTENLPSGIYFIKTIDENGKVSNAKFVKE